jgi:dTMP kinase
MNGISNLDSKRGVQFMDNSNKKIHKDAGMLIACEGISGCGKSVSIQELSTYLESEGHSVHIVEWNSNKRIRKLVRFLHSKKLLNAFTYSILQWISFLKDYYTSILPLLKKDCIVIADRYIYTGITRDRVNGTTERLGKLILKMVRPPDILFFFDTSPEVCKKRIIIRKKKLFHTNKHIHKNRLLRDKDLYYLKKLRSQYLNCFNALGISKEVNVVHIINNHCSICDSVKSFIAKRTDTNKSMV